MQIRSGPAAVIGHGTVTAFAGSPLELRVDAHTAVVLTFASDPTTQELSLEAGFDADGTLRLHLVNFDGADGRGSAVPVELGEVGGRRRYFHFRVFRYGRTDDRTVHFTFYEVDPTAAGGA